MSTKKESYLKTLFKSLNSGTIVTTEWLKNTGISNDLIIYYLRSGWLESIGQGAYKKPDDVVEWPGAIHAIQYQNRTNVHVGGLSALELHGFSHYLRLSKQKLYLFTLPNIKLPKWFSSKDWNKEIFQKRTAFLPQKTGVKEFEKNNITIKISSPERAIMECLYLTPGEHDLAECYHVFEGMGNLRPKLLEELLVSCNSLKVKRLFLYMAEKANHQWFQFLKTEKIDMGKGIRMIVKDGTYIPKYLISIPKELAEL
ncbi:MAG: type IV toxin-antitoxin system AbiEi family antitoxin [Bacteroidetes bacterium]|nr:type IV toxin-antitoxin system AbiEi family antitoxin [Bacteroidota bacterium]MBU1720365.1 type IV toxin-antitoxin system AbiEi family antitoxin [Bacteroidota bacterium]